MSAARLHRRLVERVWGTRSLPAWAGPAEPERAIGEIWFEGAPADDPDLLVKYLFTREFLSVQVHPDDSRARRLGHRSGKSEAWLVLDAEPGAVIGLGLREAVGKEALRAAAQNGEIQQLIDWRPVSVGDFIFVPAGTVHAIGPGLVLIEIQQNLDLTYRLYDYGRPRELHLDAGVEGADAGPWRAPPQPGPAGGGREILHAGDAFVVERWRDCPDMVLDAAELLLIPLSDGASLDGEACAPGEVWRVAGRARLSLGPGAEIIAAYPGKELQPLLPA